jgi:hypothetical protein
MASPLYRITEVCREWALLDIHFGDLRDSTVSCQDLCALNVCSDPSGNGASLCLHCQPSLSFYKALSIFVNFQQTVEATWRSEQSHSEAAPQTVRSVLFSAIFELQNLLPLSYRKIFLVSSCDRPISNRDTTFLTVRLLTFLKFTLTFSSNSSHFVYAVAILTQIT